MAPSTTTAPAANVSRGTVKNFNQPRGFGFITDGNGVDHFFHVENGRVGDVGDRFTGRRELRVPQRGDKMYFIPGPPRTPGKNPCATSWAFELTETAAPSAPVPQPRRLPVLTPTPSPAAALEPLEVIIARKVAGLIGLHTAFLQLTMDLPDPVVRIFCELALDGEALWLDYTASLQAAKAAGDPDYNVVNYALDLIRPNITRLLGPKSCLQPRPWRAMIWQQALTDTGSLTDVDIAGLHLQDPATLKKHERTCAACNLTNCTLYPRDARREQRRDRYRHSH